MPHKFVAFGSTSARLAARFLTIFTVLLLISSCNSNSLTVVAEFANTHDIDVGTKVWFEGQEVGEVTDIDRLSDGSKATLSLDLSAASKLSSNSAVVVNRLKKGAPLEIYNRSSTLTETLREGQSIRGLDSMLQLGAWMVGDAIQLGSSTLNEYIESFQGYLDSESFENDKVAVKKQFESAKQHANDVLQELEADVKAAAAELAVSEQAAAEAIEELGNELAPMVEQMSGDGIRLAAELHKFAAAIEKSSLENQQAGEAFLASLLTTLERLNHALEKGAGQTEPAAPEGTLE